MYTIVIEASTPLNRTSRIKMYKNNARSRLFLRIVKRPTVLSQEFLSKTTYASPTKFGRENRESKVVKFLSYYLLKMELEHKESKESNPF